LHAAGAQASTPMTVWRRLQVESDSMDIGPEPQLTSVQILSVESTGLSVAVEVHVADDDVLRFQHGLIVWQSDGEARSCPVFSASRGEGEQGGDFLRAVGPCDGLKAGVA